MQHGGQAAIYKGTYNTWPAAIKVMPKDRNKHKHVELRAVRAAPPPALLLGSDQEARFPALPGDSAAVACFTSYLSAFTASIGRTPPSLGALARRPPKAGRRFCPCAGARILRHAGGVAHFPLPWTWKWPPNSGMDAASGVWCVRVPPRLRRFPPSDVSLLPLPSQPAHTCIPRALPTGT